MSKQKPLVECKTPKHQILWERKVRAEKREYAKRHQEKVVKWRKANRDRHLKSRRDYYYRKKTERILAEMAQMRGA